MILTAALLERRSIRFDKQLVWLAVTAAIGWLGSNAYYHVGVLQWRSGELEQVQQVIAPHQSPTATVSKSKALKAQISLAKQLGCIDDRAAAEAK